MNTMAEDAGKTCNEKAEFFTPLINGSQPPRPGKRHRHGGVSPLSRFKGVVLQQNGHWGAQIYANHQRIWLGTFKTERAAAMAYDSAAIKLRSGDAHRNFPWTALTEQEHKFQTLHSTDAVLAMIKDSSYESRLAEFLRTQAAPPPAGGAAVGTDGGFLCQDIFQKELTPSDVGKLNRLVIPKKHAVKYFPQAPNMEVGEEDCKQAEDLQLVFFDKHLRSWKFRYCYWKSSQSYVFTKGWNRFVKEKELKAKDVVTFYKCEIRGGFQEVKRFCMIDVEYGSIEGSPVTNVKSLGGLGEERWAGLRLGLGGGHERRQAEEGEDADGGKVLQTPHKKRVRLFGVDID